MGGFRKIKLHRGVEFNFASELHSIKPKFVIYYKTQICDLLYKTQICDLLYKTQICDLSRWFLR